MKRDSLDEALRRKLHDAEAGLPVPPWAEMQRRMQLHANAHPAERAPLFRSWSHYAAAAVVLLGIGLGVWRVQRTHSWGEKSMAETVALPLPVSGSDSASRTAPAFNDTALNRIMKSARSVRLIDPRPAIRRRLGIIRTTRLRPEAICRRNRIGPQRPPPTES